MILDRREQALLRWIESWQDEDGNTYAGTDAPSLFKTMVGDHLFDSVIRRTLLAPAPFPSDAVVRSLEAKGVVGCALGQR